ncbi:hypothetical protein I6E49_01385 [Prevotella stercorea]|uniref:hypothetical protein n=1 Tax=Leyella stercorea TaxID=363265 RepID=UPI001F33EE66|nr:hypothetical protein [Leyella stercorea]MCF2643979.1 hypothetical protein [Leyella stercorea]
MIKDINNNANSTNANSTSANSTTNNQVNGCQHVQLGGIAFYDESKYFLFSPDDSVPDKVQRMRRMHGVAQQMTDGTFDFVAQPRVRSQSQLIRKLAHGRVSKTKDGAIQLTLKITANENINIAQAIAVESAEATDAIVKYQLRR